MDRRRYPADWPAISKRIRFERAGGRCERCGAEYLKPHPRTGAKVVLAVAHLGTPRADGTPVSKLDTMDCRDENLAALCQPCHLSFDRDIHNVRFYDRVFRRRRYRDPERPVVQLEFDYGANLGTGALFPVQSRGQGDVVGQASAGRAPATGDVGGK